MVDLPKSAAKHWTGQGTRLNKIRGVKLKVNAGVISVEDVRRNKRSLCLKVYTVLRILRILKHI